MPRPINPERQAAYIDSGKRQAKKRRQRERNGDYPCIPNRAAKAFQLQQLQEFTKNKEVPK